MSACGARSLARTGSPLAGALARPLTAAALLGTAATLAGMAGAAPTPTECHVAGIANSVQCGSLSRALDPRRPDGTRIDVHFVVVPALARRKLPDPVFLLAGGPGQSAIEVAPQTLALFGRLNQRRDIVFIDQRGTGLSAPLRCPDPQHETLAEQSDPDRQFQALMQCKAQLLRLPYIRSEQDLGLFTTSLAAQDLDAVRVLLGAPRINLVGVSYGTRVGLDVMRQFPATVRRSVLDAVVPPDMVLPVSASTDNQAALEALLSACDRETACTTAYPRLRADWQALLAGLPRPSVAAHPLTGRTEHFTLTRELALGSVRGALYVPAMAAGLPAAITAAAHQRDEPLLGMGSLLGARNGLHLATGMHFSVVCAEDAPRMDAASDPPGRDFGGDYATLYRRACAHWPRGPVEPAFYRVARTETPTLLLSGALDPATPPRHGARVAAALGPAAVHVVVANAGHGALGTACGHELLYRFIDATDDAQARSLNTACLGSIPRPGVYVPLSDLPVSAP